jgi:hypothetical protein
VIEAASQPASETGVDNSAVPLVIRLESAPEPVKAQAPVEAVPAYVSPVVETPEPRVATAPSKLPAADLAAAGLQLVETATPASADAADVEERAASPRRRRSRGGRGNAQPDTQADAQAPTEALVMVETTHSESPAAPASSESPSEWGPPSNPRRRARPKSADQVVAEPLVMVETKAAASEQNTAV